MTSGPGAAPRHWSHFLRDMIQFCDETLHYTAGLDRQRFQAGGPTYDATLWNIVLIGETVNRIPADVWDLERAIPWRDSIDARNYPIHNYSGIDEDIHWDVIKIDIFVTLPRLRTLLESLEQEPRSLV